MNRGHQPEAIQPPSLAGFRHYTIQQRKKLLLRHNSLWTAVAKTASQRLILKQKAGHKCAGFYCDPAAYTARIGLT